jgi:hypothetical protein
MSLLRTAHVISIHHAASALKIPWCVYIADGFRGKIACPCQPDKMNRLTEEGGMMAGNKEKPCFLCVYNDFLTWLNHPGEDICFQCKEANKWAGINPPTMTINRLTEEQGRIR